MRPHYRQSSHENATPSSGTFLLASCKGVPPPPGFRVLQLVKPLPFIYVKPEKGTPLAETLRIGHHRVPSQSRKPWSSWVDWIVYKGVSASWDWFKIGATWKIRGSWIVCSEFGYSFQRTCRLIKMHDNDLKLYTKDPETIPCSAAHLLIGKERESPLPPPLLPHSLIPGNRP